MADGSSAPFEALVAEHGRRVQRVCNAILRDEHLGADAAQETFVRLWRRLCEGRAPERFGGWLRRVAVSTSLDLLRRRPRGQVSDEDACPEPTAPDDPQALAARHELDERFEAALSALSEGQRTVFLLRHAGGLRLAEVAETLGVALPTVKTQFARACLKLQARLAPFREPERESAREPAHEPRPETGHRPTPDRDPGDDR